MAGPAPASLQSSSARSEQSRNSAGLFLNWIIAGAAFATRQLPGMAMFNPMMLSMAWNRVPQHRRYCGLGQQGVTFSLHRLLLTARGFWPAWLGTLVLLFIASFSLTLIKLME
jgi:hypothetical protein